MKLVLADDDERSLEEILTRTVVEDLDEMRAAYVEDLEEQDTVATIDRVRADLIDLMSRWIGFEPGHDGGEAKADRSA